jgi:Flp pilus assembly protein TadD
VESPLIRNHLAEASERAGDFAAAMRHHQVALRLRPNWALTHRSLGRLMARQGDFDAAERHLREAVQIDPGDARARADLDDLLRCRQESATAAACLAGTILARADDRRP